MYSYSIHHSHKPIDMSDVSLIIDVMCDYCHKTDEKLTEACPSVPLLPNYYARPFKVNVSVTPIKE